jgi:hypothetical protein
MKFVKNLMKFVKNLMKFVKNLMKFVKKIKKKEIPLPDNLGSWFSVYNLILAQLDEICQNKWGAIKKI